MKKLSNLWIEAETTVKTAKIIRNVFKVGSGCLMMLMVVMLFSGCSSTGSDAEESVIEEEKEVVETTISNTTFAEEDGKDNDELSSSSSSEDWDAVLKNYESFIDQYIKFLKKANNGDMSAMTEYVKMMEKAEELGSKLAGAGNELSPSQTAKYVKLQTKFASAALEIN